MYLVGSAAKMRPEEFFRWLFGFYCVTASTFKEQYRKGMPKAHLAWWVIKFASVLGEKFVD